MSSTNKQIIPVLDMFRLVAALFVVLVHYEIIFGHFVIYGSLGTTALSWLHHRLQLPELGGAAGL